MANLTRNEFRKRVGHVKGTAFLLLEEILESRLKHHTVLADALDVQAALGILALDTNNFLDDLVYEGGVDSDLGDSGNGNQHPKCRPVLQSDGGRE